MRKIVHISPGVLGRGGIESLHAYHRELPFEQHFVALFDKGLPEGSVTGTCRSTPEGHQRKVVRRVPATLNYSNLNFTWRTPLVVMRRRIREALAPHAGAIVIYHNGWGFPLFRDLDGAARRIVVFHADPAYHAPDCPGFRGFLDGLGAVTPALETLWARELPEVGTERKAILRIPVSPPSSREREASGPLAGAHGYVSNPCEVPNESARSALAATRGPVVLGYAGRIERAQKRLDRLPAFLAELDKLGVNYRFELLGEGGYRRELQGAMRPALSAKRVRFHGWMPKEDYWRIMATWDAVVYFSDHEGGPTGLLEGMAAGAIPFYPAHGGSLGDAYAPQVDPVLYYKPGDTAELARAVREVFGRSAEAIEKLRAKSIALVRDHTPAEYKRACTELIEKVDALPRISGVPPARKPRITDCLPLGFVTRAWPRLLR